MDELRKLPPRGIQLRNQLVDVMFRYLDREQIRGVEYMIEQPDFNQAVRMYIAWDDEFRKQTAAATPPKPPAKPTRG